MKKLFTEYWQEFDVQYIKNMYGAELPLLYFVIYWSWSLVFGNAAGTDATSVTEKIILAAAVIFPTVFSFISFTLHPIVSVSAEQSGAAKAGYGQISFPGGASYDGLHSRHGSGSIYGAGRTVLVSSYFME